LCCAAAWKGLRTLLASRRIIDHWPAKPHKAANKRAWTAPTLMSYTFFGFGVPAVRAALEALPNAAEAMIVPNGAACVQLECCALESV
jgi:hypothetical protein